MNETNQNNVGVGSGSNPKYVAITPTVGRVVNYWPHKSDPVTQLDTRQPLAAIVAYVHPGGKELNLSVFDSNGDARSRTSVPLVQDGEPKPEDKSFAAWMPYQKQVASGALPPAVHVPPPPAPKEPEFVPPPPKDSTMAPDNNQKLDI